MIKKGFQLREDCEGLRLANCSDNKTIVVLEFDSPRFLNGWRRPDTVNVGSIGVLHFCITNSGCVCNRLEVEGGLHSARVITSV